MKKTAKKKTAKKRSAKKRSAESTPNLQLLVKEGVVTEKERLTAGELQVIESLTPEEVAALRSIYKKFARHPNKSPFWRAFCF